MTTVAKSGTPHVRIASTASSRADSITTFGRHTGFASLAGQAHKLENANVNTSSPRGGSSDGVNSNARSGSSLSSKPSFARKKKASASAEGGESESQWGANFWVTLVEPQVCRYILIFWFDTPLNGRSPHVLLIDPNSILCLSCYGRSQLGPASRQLRVRNVSSFRTISLFFNFLLLVFLLVLRENGGNFLTTVGAVYPITTTPRRTKQYGIDPMLLLFL